MEDNKAYYRKRLDGIMKASTALMNIEDGTSMAKACRDNGISLKGFRKLLNIELSPEKDEITYIPDWRDELMKDVYGASYGALPDFDEAFGKACGTMFEEEDKAIRLKYEKGFDSKRIGTELGIGTRAANIALRRAVEKLKWQKNAVMLTQGLDYARAESELRRARLARSEAVRNVRTLIDKTNAETESYVKELAMLNGTINGGADIITLKPREAALK